MPKLEKKEEEATTPNLEEQVEGVVKLAAQVEETVDGIKTDMVPKESFDALTEKFDTLQKQLDTVEAKAKGPSNGPAEVAGWSSLGEFAYHVYEAAQNSMLNRSASEKLSTYHTWCKETSTADKEGKEQFAATGTVRVGIPSEGGYLIPPQFLPALREAMTKFSSFMEKADTFQMGSPIVKVPYEDVSSIAESGVAAGVRMYWVKEVPSSITASQPALGEIEFTLNELAGIAPVSHQMMKYSPMSIDGYLRNKFATALAYKTEKAMIWGTGAGQPLGLTVCDSAVSVSRDTASRVLVEDIDAMLTPIWPNLLGGAVWLAHPNVRAQLSLLAMPVGTGGGPAYMPEGGYAATPYASLKGLPVIYTPHCENLGTAGDLILVDWSQYALASDTMEFASSIHLYFSTGRTAFRVWAELEGQPWWPQKIQDENDSSLYYTWATYLS